MISLGLVGWEMGSGGGGGASLGYVWRVGVWTAVVGKVACEPGVGVGGWV